MRPFFEKYIRRAVTEQLWEIGRHVLCVQVVVLALLSTSDASGKSCSSFDTDVYFGSGSNFIDRSEKDRFQVRYLRLQALSKDLGVPVRIQIFGHADRREGSSRRRMSLSVDRAQSLARLVRQLDPTAEIVYFTGVGAEENIADSKVPEGRAKNRRAAMIVVGTRCDASEPALNLPAIDLAPRKE